MKKTIKKCYVLLACLWIAASPPAAIRAEESYTYTYDTWKEVQHSPDAYSVVKVFTAGALGLDKKLSAPEGMFVSGSDVYLCDTGNNRILEFKRTEKQKMTLTRTIDCFYGKEGDSAFAGPTDIAVGKDGSLYIADKNNGRILKLDKDLNIICEFVKPADATFDQSASFLPSKIAVDDAGRVYCVATNVNKGLIKYEPDGTFSGFTGATEVTYDWTDYIWKKLATKEQRAQMESFVPTEYDNICIDEEGFFYVCTTNVSEGNLSNGSAKPIRRLNLMGSDILVRNGSDVIGDLYFDEGGGYKGPSLFVDVAALENGIYAGLDKVRGRLFVYDSQGRMMYAFGGNGSIDGYFRRPAAIARMGRDLLVLDSLDASITLFSPTEYGELIFEAINQFQSGKYEESGETWQKVLAQNGNYDLAYNGIGRALLRQKKYKEAMEYFSSKLDAENYSKAFKQYRKEWVEEHILWILAAFFLLLCLPLAAGRLKAIKREIDAADIFRR